MLMPKKVKFRKQQRGRMTGKAWRGSSLAFGEYGLKALECGWITSRQIEAARIAMTRFIKRGGKVWIRMFPDKPITKKPAETRMGKGKGAPEEWVAVIRPGKILFEMEGVPLDIATEAMRLAAAKLAIPTKLVRREFEGMYKMKPNKFRELDSADLNNQARETRRAVVPPAVPDRNGAGRRREAVSRTSKDRARMLGVLRERELDPAKARQRKSPQSRQEVRRKEEG